MAMLGKIAGRYAKALFDELKGKSHGEKVVEELGKFAALTAEHKELSLLIGSPGFSEAQKTAVITDVAEKMRLSKESIQILKSISRMGRTPYLAGIVKRLRVKLLESEGIQPIHVWTADTVAADEKTHIEEKFAKLLGRKVEATYESNPQLVGGLRVVAGGRTYDGTVAGWLGELQERLVEGEA